MSCSSLISDSHSKFLVLLFQSTTDGNLQRYCQSKPRKYRRYKKNRADHRELGKVGLLVERGEECGPDLRSFGMGPQKSLHAPL